MEVVVIDANNWGATLKARLTLCVLRLPGSRSLMSRRLFCLLLCGCWPRRHRRRRCSHQKPRPLSTGAGEVTDRNKNCSTIDYFALVCSIKSQKMSKKKCPSEIPKSIWHPQTSSFANSWKKICLLSQTTSLHDLPERTKLCCSLAIWWILGTQTHCMMGNSLCKPKNGKSNTMLL